MKVLWLWTRSDRCRHFRVVRSDRCRHFRVKLLVETGVVTFELLVVTGVVTFDLLVLQVSSLLSCSFQKCHHLRVNHIKGATTFDVFILLYFFFFVSVFYFYNCIVPTGFLTWEINSGCLPRGMQAATQSGYPT